MASTVVPVVLPTAEAERIEAEIEAVKPKPEPVRTPPTDEEWAALLQKERKRDAEDLAYITDPTQRWLFMLSRGRTEEAAWEAPLPKIEASTEDAA